MVLMCWVTLAAAVRADEPSPPGKPLPPGQSLPAYGDWNRDCLEWSDGCAVCKRSDEASAKGAFACSTPGIACQPKGIVCLRRMGSPAKK